MPQLEIAVTSLEDAIHAAQGGADSIEISQDLSVGGLTPDAALVESVVRKYQKKRIAILVMIRPHARGFVYDRDDIKQIDDSVRVIKALQVDGVVFGACDPSGRLDIDLIDRVQRESAPTPLTVHRALDLSVEPERALSKLAAIGIRRVLTAGPATTAWEGRETLGSWVKRYAPKIDFVVSGSLTTEQFPEMRAATNAQVYHFGSAARTNGIVDATKVRALSALIKV